MSALTEFDIGPLTWVKGEIDQALVRAREALALFSENPADFTPLKFCQTHLHQVTGAIQMVGLDGVTGFSEEIEKLASMLEKQEVTPDNVVQAIDKACASLGRYLDDLVNDEPNVPLKLFPEYQALLRLRGEEHVSPSDLFFPDLTVRPPKGAEVAAIPEVNLPAHIKALRARFQRGLLLFLRGDRTGLNGMLDAVKTIEKTQTSPAQRAFWWSSVGLFDGLAQQGLDINFSLKQLCARIDIQIRYLAEGSPKVAERLFRDVLYFVATCEPVSERIRDLKKCYELDAYIPLERSESQSDIDLTRLQPLLREYRDVLQLIKTSWVKHSSGSGDTAQLKLHLITANQAAQKLAHPALITLQAAVDHAVNTLTAGAVTEALAMEFATALLLAENALDSFSRLSPEFPRQVEVMVQRLEAAVSGKLLDADMADISLLDDISRKAQEKLLMSQVVQEIQTNLRYIEQVLDTFFRDHGKREELNTLPPFMKQVLGAFSILGLDHAAELLKICQTQIEQFAQADYTPAEGEMELLAESLSNLGFYVQAVEHGQNSNERMIQTLLRRHAGLPDDGDDTIQTDNSATVEDSIEAEKQQVNTLFDAWQQKPDDEKAKDELRQALTSVKQDATLVADNALRDQTANMLELLDQSGDDVGESLTEAMEVLAAPKTVVAAPSADAVRMVNASAEVLDAELLEIFLEEADEVLVTVGDNLSICQSHPHNHEALVVIRRGFHTLKGSGRMVGLNDFGEIAWAVEQVLNKWLEQEITVTPALLKMLSVAQENFTAWVAGLRTTGSIAVDAQHLLNLIAEAEGIEPAAAPVVVEATEPQELEAPEIIMPEVELEAVDAFPALSEFEEEVGFSPVLDIEEAEFSTVEIASPVVTHYASESEVMIGEVVLSATLYNILVEEAGQHLATLARELENLRQNPANKIKHEFLRAAHTLCGIHRTAGFPVIAELGFALEQWLLAVSDQPVFQDPDCMQVLESTVAALTQMIQGLHERQAPTAEDKRNSNGLIAHLREMVQQVNLQSARGNKASDVLPASPAVDDDFEAVTEPANGLHLVEAAGEIALPSLELPPEMTVSAPETVEAINLQPVAETPMLSLVENSPIVAVAATSVPDVQSGYESENENTATLQDDIDEQLLPIFLEEAEELFPLLGNELRTWRANPTERESAQSLGRVLHTLKGSARMAGAMQLGELAHHMETRVGTADLPGIAGPAFFEALDADFDRINESLERLQAGGRTAEPVAALTQAANAEAAVTQIAAADVEAGTQRAMLRVRADMVDRLVNEAGEVSIARSRIEGEMRAVKQNLFELTENVTRLRSQLREIEIQAESQMQSQLSLLKEEEEGFDPLEFDRFTRFQELTRMMAESVNDVSTVQLNLLKNLDETDAALLSQARMNRDLQQELMRIRTVPFSSLMERLYRVLRQTAKEVDKKANLEIRGSQVELDRSVLEKLIAPLEHLLRNAIDHGLEPKATRIEKGKPEIGEIGLTVRQEGNEIALILSDDGAGLNLERIREKALAKGMLAADESPTDAQVMEFIFAPGFSTASAVTQVSGRGIGMDVVRNEIVNLGGRVQVASIPDKGTTFTLYLPLTLAVAQAVLVRAGGHTYALPSAMVEQVQELKAEPLAAVYAAKEVEWQGNKYPFAYLPRMLGDEEHMPETMRYSPLLLLRSGLQRAAIHVDELIGNQEIVVKNIGPQLARVSGIAGATVLGNGMVVLILNAVQLAQRQDPALAYKATSIPSAPVQTALPVAMPLIMVVDDSLTVRKITSRLLTREGFQPITAKDGVDGLQVMQENIPDVILLDIEMPRMDGFEFAKNVRGDAATAHIPIIMITSRTAEKHRARALEIGVDVYLGKPYQEEELLHHIQACLENSRRHSVQ